YTPLRIYFFCFFPHVFFFVVEKGETSISQPGAPPVRTATCPTNVVEIGIFLPATCFRGGRCLGMSVARSSVLQSIIFPCGIYVNHLALFGSFPFDALKT
ncbi:unnamed protein product, partial [Ectocarpus sp. 12 AP-2014]